MKRFVGILGLVVASAVVFWLPFVAKVNSLPGWGINFSPGMEKVFANFDGPNYLIVAKSWYDKSFIGHTFSNPLPLEYYPAHLPLYPFLVWLADVVLPGTWAMLLVTLVGSILMFGMFFIFVKEVVSEKTAWWLSLTLLVLPARLLTVRMVGSPEPWFIFFVLATLYLYRKEKYLLAGIAGVAAQWTKSPAILLFVGLCLYHCYRFRDSLFSASSWKQMLKSWPILLMPLSVLPLFYFYQVRTGDFWAYFNSGDNFHLFFPPFSIFSPKGQFWTGEFWLEEIVWIWLVYGMGVLRLWKKDLRLEAIFAGVFFFSTLFVAHRDIARYILPIAPLVLLGWKEIIVSKEFRWLLLLMIIPVYLFSWNFVLNNVAPVADWTPYL